MRVRLWEHLFVPSRVLSLLWALTLMLLTAGASAASDIIPMDLRCEGLSNPLGIETPHPA